MEFYDILTHIHFLYNGGRYIPIECSTLFIYLSFFYLVFTLLHLKSHLTAGFCKDGQREKKPIIYPRHLPARAASRILYALLSALFSILRKEHFHFGPCLTPVRVVNLTGDILRVYQGLQGVWGRAGGSGGDSDGFGETTIVVRFWDVWKVGKYKLVHCVHIFRQAHVLALSVGLNLRNSCRDSVIGTAQVV